MLSSGSYSSCQIRNPVHIYASGRPTWYKFQICSGYWPMLTVLYSYSPTKCKNNPSIANCSHCSQSCGSCPRPKQKASRNHLMRPNLQSRWSSARLKIDWRSCGSICWKWLSCWRWRCLISRPCQRRGQTLRFLQHLNRVERRSLWCFERLWRSIFGQKFLCRHCNWLKRRIRDYYLRTQPALWI